MATNFLRTLSFENGVAVLSLKHAPSGSTIQMLVQYFGQSGFDVDGSISASWHTSLLNQSPRSASLETLLV